MRGAAVRPASELPTEVRFPDPARSVEVLVATRPDGSTVELGGRAVGNDTWGCYAG